MNKLNTNCENRKNTEEIETSIVAHYKVESTMEAPLEQKVQEHPFPYIRLDPAKAEERAYNSYYNKGGCCAAVADAIIGELADIQGTPFKWIPIKLFIVGAGGYGIGTLCGALAGAAHAIALVCEPDDSKRITAELFTWHCEEELPKYQPKMEILKTISNSVNCLETLNIFMEAANVKRSDKLRRERCACVSADVARKAVELLNEHFCM